jgi:hypothetical protein
LICTHAVTIILSRFTCGDDADSTHSEHPSPGHLLEAGFLCVQQGRYTKGLAFVALAREKLSPDQVHFAAVIDAFTQSHQTYSQAQEALLQASRHFLRADAELQVQLAALQNLLLVLLEETHKVSREVEKLQYKTSGHRLLQVVQPAPKGLSSNRLRHNYRFRQCEPRATPRVPLGQEFGKRLDLFASGSRAVAHSTAYDAVHGAFMTLPPYIRNRKGLVHELDFGVRNCSHTAPSRPVPATSESIERAEKALQPMGQLVAHPVGKREPKKLGFLSILEKAVWSR